MSLTPDEAMTAAGIGGSAASILIDKELTSIWQKLRHWGAGAIVAVGGGPAVVKIMNCEDFHLQVGICLIVGAVGRIVLSKLIAVVNNLDLKDIISRVIGKPLS